MISLKKPDLSDLPPKKKNQKVLMKIEEIADVFLNSANFRQHAFFTLAPPISSIWNDFLVGLKWKRKILLE